MRPLDTAAPTPPETNPAPHATIRPLIAMNLDKIYSSLTIPNDSTLALVVLFRVW